MTLDPKQLALGIGILLFTKYVLFGLNTWNGIFHPERQENVDTIFAHPLLGIFDDSTPLGTPASGKA